MSTEFDVVCDDPAHADRSTEPDWVAVLGTCVGEAAPAGHICPACIRLTVPPE